MVKERVSPMPYDHTHEITKKLNFTYSVKEKE